MIKTRLQPSSLVYCLTAVATDASGRQRTCSPMHFFVRDPVRSWKGYVDEPVFQQEKTNAGSKNAGMTCAATKEDPGDSVLVSYGLTAALEQQFSAVDNKVSGFWELIDAELDQIRLDARNHAREGSAFNFVLTHDCNMRVKSAYGADGIYLLFEVNDDDDVAWPNQLVGTENEQFYLNFDAVDVLMDSRSVEEISDPENLDMFFTKGFGLTVTTKQYQIACGTEKERPTGFVRSVPDPWDMAAKYYTFDEAKEQFGLEIENIKTDYYYKAQEIFIPWSEVGGGLTSEPDAGTRLGFAAGFNDRDEGEHFPPGVNTSGGSVHASNAIRWIGRTDPWGAGPRYSKPPYAWGEIEIGPMLE